MNHLFIESVHNPLCKQTAKLLQKKYRDQEQAFLLEGEICLYEALACGFVPQRVFFRPDALSPEALASLDKLSREKDVLLLAANQAVIRKIADTVSPPPIIAVFAKFSFSLDALFLKEDCFILVLDGLQDPGNLGTILRIADWFGIEHIVCISGTADVFSPKTVQATMGSLARVKVHYTHLEAYLTKNRQSSVYGAFLDGDNIFKKKLSHQGIIVMGNEGNGIRPAIEALIREKLYIPSYPPGGNTTESLNVAMATAIICAEFRRQV